MWNFLAGVGRVLSIIWILGDLNVTNNMDLKRSLNEHNDGELWNVSYDQRLNLI